MLLLVVSTLLISDGALLQLQWEERCLQALYLRSSWETLFYLSATKDEEM